MKRLQLCLTRRTVEMAALFLVMRLESMSVVLLCRLGDLIRVLERFPMLRMTVRRFLT